MPAEAAKPALEQIGYGLYVVGSKNGDEVNGMRLGVTVDVFNAFNNKNFGCFDTGFNSPNYGKAGCLVSDARRTQIGAEYTF